MRGLTCFARRRAAGLCPWLRRRLGAGKNRPLDEGELEFIQKLEDEEASKLRAIRATEAEGLKKFEEIQRAAAEEASGAAPGAKASTSGAGGSRFAPRQRKRGKVQVAARAEQGHGANGGASEAHAREGALTDGQKHDRREGDGREGASAGSAPGDTKTGAARAGAAAGATILQGLLGGYGEASSVEGSDSDG